jgi:transcriptional regulator with PAS, ATPase and Fis domain
MQAGPKRLIFAAVPQQSHTEYTSSFHNDFSLLSHLPTPPAIEREADAGPQEFMVGECPAMREVFNQIRRLGGTDAPILISGETGTGKELAALAIHQRSSRNKGPFIALNCAALPASLISSELFGFEKGAFTGATSRKIGLIELANNGTLFLDEIGDLPADLQGYLLRFLQEGTITRVGGHASIKVNARIISATHVKLTDAMSAGKFREDLFYRLNILPLHMPPLRERESDIDLMANFFLRKISVEFGREITGFAPEAQEAIRAHRWPGNVREMIAAIRRAVVMGNEPFVTKTDLGLTSTHAPSSIPSLHQITLPRRPSSGSVQERNALQQSLERNNNNITRTALELCVSRVTIYRMLKRHSINL